MMLTTKGRYAVMAILEMASKSSAEPVTLNEMSVKQNISLNYLEQIFSKLKNADLVKAIRGSKGGCIF